MEVNPNNARMEIGMKRITNDQNGWVRFFQAFAERAYKENDLSDVTYAVCRSDDAFMQLFLDFFFEGIVQVDNVKTFEREHCEDMGRPDFWIETKDGKVYIIEVKIGDWNQHFEQYHKLLKKQNSINSVQAWGHLGYIANYKVKTTENGKAINENCHTRTWQEFKSKIEENDCRNNQLVAAYVHYLKSICHFYEITIPDGWKIRGEDFKCFRKLVEEFDVAIKNTSGSWKDSVGGGRGKWECKVYSRSKRNFASQWCFGEFFELTNFDRKGNSVWGWLGAYYAEEGITICVEFEDRQGWGKPVCDKFRRQDIMEDGALRFWIGKNATKDIKIEDFFRKVISIVVGDPPLANEPNVDIEFAENGAKCFKKEALPMKFLPYVLETQLLSQEFRKKLKGKGYMMELSECEDQWCYCGRSFVLKPIISGKVNNRHQRRGGIDGWLGVIFKYGQGENNGWGENKNAKGNSLREFPTFVVEMDKNYLGKRIKKRSGNVIWYEDDYGYGCHDIYIEDEGMVFKDILDEARKVILGTLKTKGR